MGSCSLSVPRPPGTPRSCCARATAAAHIANPVMTSGLFFIEKLRPLEIHYTVAHLPRFNRWWPPNHGGKPEADRPLLLLGGNRILTNSSYGACSYHWLFRRPLGRMAAQLLIEQGHRVVLHARNEKRGKEALAAVPGAETVVIGDLTSIAQTCVVADQFNGFGSFETHGTRLPQNSDWSAQNRGKTLLMPKSNEHDSCDT
jgi:hypothetical protein